ncbi:MAG: hypothetical protein ACK4NC_04405 [Candidatus Gracilibacteria bacterium]
MSPLWVCLLIVGLIGLIVYTIFFRRVKEITVGVRPITFLSIFLVAVPILFFLEYSHVLGYFSGIFEQLGLAAKDIPAQLGQQLGVSDVSLFAAGSVFVKFMEKYIMGVFSIIILFLSALGAGLVFRKLLGSFRNAERFFLQILGGFAVLCTVLIFIGWAGLFHTTVLQLLIAVAALLGIIFEGKSIWNSLTTKTVKVYSLLGAVSFWTCGVLIAVLAALSFMHVLRPMPIGWDDITLYMNLPNLTAQYHHLVSGFGTYSWGLIMALGFSLFGSATFGMLYSFAGGLLAIWGIYLLFSYKESEGTQVPLALILTTVFAAAPFFQFQFSEDMKVDLALTAFGSGSLILMMEYFQAETSKREKGILVLLGVLLGCMLGIKFTALIFFFFAAVFIGWKYGKALLALAISLFFTAFLFAANIISLGGIVYPKEWVTPTAVILIISGIGVLFFAFSKSKDILKSLKALLLMGIISFLMFAPWMAYNASSYCDVKEQCKFQGLNSMLYGKLKAPTLVPKEVSVATENPINPDAVELKKILEESGGSQVEELQRYRGFDKGVFSYATLPVDATMGTNERGDYITIGWVFLALLPFAFMAGVLNDLRKKNRLEKIYFGIGIVLALMLFAFSVSGTKLALPAAFGDYSQGIIFVITGLMYAGVYGLWRLSSNEEDPVHVKALVAATLLYWFTWTYLANGVIWYGILGFLPLLLLAKRGLEKLYAAEREWFAPIVLLILLFWITPMYAYKMTVNDVQVPVLGSSWKAIVEKCETAKNNPANAQILANTIQSLITREEDQTAVAKACSLYMDRAISKADFENAAQAGVAEIVGKQYGMPDSLTFILYKAGILNNEEDAMAQMNVPYANAISEIRKVDPSVKIYRIGTFMPYYTPQNDRRMLTDNQLDVFMQYYLPEMDEKAFIKTLKDSGIGYIVYDNKTETIDKTPQKTLTKKVELFKNFRDLAVKNKDLDLIVGTGISSDAILVYKLL